MYEQMLNDEPGLEEYSAGSDSEISNSFDSDDVSINSYYCCAAVDLMYRRHKPREATRSL